MDLQHTIGVRVLFLPNRHSLKHLETLQMQLQPRYQDISSTWEPEWKIGLA